MERHALSSKTLFSTTPPPEVRFDGPAIGLTENPDNPESRRIIERISRFRKPPSYHGLDIATGPIISRFLSISVSDNTIKLNGLIRRDISFRLGDNITY